MLLIPILLFGFAVQPAGNGHSWGFKQQPRAENRASSGNWMRACCSSLLLLCLWLHGKWHSKYPECKPSLKVVLVLGIVPNSQMFHSLRGVSREKQYGVHRNVLLCNPLYVVLSSCRTVCLIQRLLGNNCVHSWWCCYFCLCLLGVSFNYV